MKEIKFPSEAKRNIKALVEDFLEMDRGVLLEKYRSDKIAAAELFWKSLRSRRGSAIPTCSVKPHCWSSSTAEPCSCCTMTRCPFQTAVPACSGSSLPGQPTASMEDAR